MNASVYINWALYSVYGLMAEADALRREFTDEIDAVADELFRRRPVSQPLYRGMLLDAADAVRPKPNLMHLSWSEDLDVARWFGSPTSYISEPFVERYPWVKGFVLTAPHAPARMLWHHSWRRAFGPPLEELALAHPLMGYEGYRQVQWSLNTQREVITATLPIERLPTRVPIEEVPGGSVDELDRRLSPRWIMRDDNIGHYGAPTT